MIAIYGGSFDPPHLGHLGVIQSFWKEFPDCKKLLLIPNHISPFKKSKGANTKHILTMLELLILESKTKNTIIEKFEILRRTPSFTLETIEYIQTIYSNEEIYFLMGLDNLIGFKNWKGYEEILKTCKILIFDRDIGNSNTIPANLQIYRERFIFVKNPSIHASSSEVRESNAAKGNKLLTSKVNDYIMENELYGYRKSN